MDRAQAREKARRAKKKKNFFAQYFSNFGLRQLSGILFLLSAIAIIVGLIIKHELTLLISFSVYAAAAALAIIHSIKGMIGRNKKSPEFKRATINLIIVSVILIIAVLGIIFIAINGIYK